MAARTARRLTTTDVLGGLAQFGRDVVGAITLAPLDDPGPGSTTPPPDPARLRSARAIPLTPDDLEHEVARLPDHPLGLHPDSELSLAGLQDKLLLVTRLHQEDACHLLDLLDRVLLTLVIGDADAHGKNLALLHDAPGHARLGPLYDTAPTALPQLRTEAAMAIGHRDDLQTLTLEDVVREARSRGPGAEPARRHLDDVLARLSAAMAAGATRDDQRVTGLVASRLARLTRP